MILLSTFLPDRQKTKESISSEFMLTLICTWSCAGFIMFDMTDTRSCLLSSLMSTCSVKFSRSMEELA